TLGLGEPDELLVETGALDLNCHGGGSRETVGEEILRVEAERFVEELGARLGHETDGVRVEAEARENGLVLGEKGLADMKAREALLLQYPSAAPLAREQVGCGGPPGTGAHDDDV